MTEFKQIVGRGTRVHEETEKFHFTLIDFRGTTGHFADSEFDGEPVQTCEPGEDDPIDPPMTSPMDDDGVPFPVNTGDEGRVVVGPDDAFPSGGRAPRKVCVDGIKVEIVLTNPPFGGREEDGVESNFPKNFQTRETADLFLALIVRLLKPDGRAAVVLPDGSLFGEGTKTRLKERLMEECNLHTIVRLPNSVFRPYAAIGTNLLFFEKGGPTCDIWYRKHLVPEGQKAYSMTRPIELEHLDDCASWRGGPERRGREEGGRAWNVTAREIKERDCNLDIKNPHSAVEDCGDPEMLVEELKAAEADVVSARQLLKDALAEALLR